MWYVGHDNKGKDFVREYKDMGEALAALVDAYKKQGNALLIFENKKRLLFSGDGVSYFYRSEPVEHEGEPI